jgi:hypothetical protein
MSRCACLPGWGCAMAGRFSGRFDIYVAQVTKKKRPTQTHGQQWLIHDVIVSLFIVIKKFQLRG